LDRLRPKIIDAANVAKFGSETPSIAFSEIWYFGEIIKANWALFEDEFAPIGLTKNEVQKRIEALNFLRRLPGHPVLAYVTGYDFTEADQRLIREMEMIFRTLARPFIGVSKARGRIERS